MKPRIVHESDGRWVLFISLKTAPIMIPSLSIRELPNACYTRRAISFESREFAFQILDAFYASGQIYEGS